MYFQGRPVLGRQTLDSSQAVGAHTLLCWWPCHRDQHSNTDGSASSEAMISVGSDAIWAPTPSRLLLALMLTWTSIMIITCEAAYIHRWYSDSDAQRRLRGGRIGGGYTYIVPPPCVLAWREARLGGNRGVRFDKKRDACIRHVGNEPCFVFFWKESTGRRHVMSPISPSIHCTDVDASCTNSDFISR